MAWSNIKVRCRGIAHNPRRKDLLRKLLVVVGELSEDTVTHFINNLRDTDYLIVNFNPTADGLKLTVSKLNEGVIRRNPDLPRIYPTINVCSFFKIIGKLQ